MKTFRVLALGYALLVLLIGPGALSADSLVAEDESAVTQEPAPAPSSEPTDPNAQPAPEPATDEAPAPVALSQEAEETTAEPAIPKAKAAKSAKEEPRADEPVAKVASSASVTISDFKFTPSTVTVNVGDTITWTNDGPTVHSATAKDGSFDTGLLDKGKSGSATFDKAGTIAYICTPHPFMKGTVVVQAASADAPDTSGGSEPTARDHDSIRHTADPTRVSGET